MTIRPAKHSDIAAITELSMESLEVNDPYPCLMPSISRTREAITSLVSGAAHFTWVHEREGKVIGAICGMVHDLMFYERKQLSVVMLYCREPGGGGLLVRRLMRWYRSRPAIKACVFTIENCIDEKLGKFLITMGLQRRLPTYIGVR